MPVKISIPASEIVGLKNTPIVLELANRCSRCERVDAGYYEIHRLHLSVGRQLNRLISSKYRQTKNLQLKIRICETCYQADFLTHPDELDLNGSALGRIAKFHSAAWTLGALFAALGFLFLTPLVPTTGFLAPLKSIWQLPVGMGVVVLFLTWLSQRKYQNKVLHMLEKNDPIFRSHSRAEISVHPLEQPDDPSAIALDINMYNESWAEEIATRRGWSFEKGPAPAGILSKTKE